MNSSACLRLNSRIYDIDQESTPRGDGRWMHWLNFVLLISLDRRVNYLQALSKKFGDYTEDEPSRVSIHHHR